VSAALALLLLCGTPAAWADEVAVPKVPDIVEALLPPPGEATRGLTRVRRKPGEKAPAAAAPTAPTVVSTSRRLILTIPFDPGSMALTPDGRTVANQLGAAIRSRSLVPYRFRIIAHTASRGDPASRMALTKERARAVADYVIKIFEIDPARVEVVGYGDRQLLVPDKPEDRRNDRVEIVNLGVGQGQ
jgi:outer membrane protein OmpA-like peptidoglycan-associated protein